MTPSFPSRTRIHIALATSHLAESTRFYTTLFGQSPTKERDGYRKFEVLDPAVNLTLNEVTHESSFVGGPQHMGIQVQTACAVQEIFARLSQGGESTLVEDGVTCCYARQDKVWATDPDGHRWEVFLVTDPDRPEHSLPTPDAPQEAGSATDARTCCAPTCCE